MVWKLLPPKRIITPLETDENGNTILRYRLDLYIKKGKVTDYVVQLEKMRSELLRQRFKPIVRFNFCHGSFHIDFIDKRGKKYKVFLGKFKNFNEAINYAINNIKSEYEKYIKNYEDGLFPNGTSPKEVEKNEKGRKKKKRGRFYRQKANS